MKKLVIVFTLFMSLCFGAVAHAESHGSAVVPTMLTTYASSSSVNLNELMLSNITGSEVECTIRFYDDEGNDIGSQARIYKGASNAANAVLLSIGATFKLPANASRLVQFHETTQRCLIGHAVVEWKSTDNKLVKALVGRVRHYGREGTNSYALSYTPINAGQPF